jgi:single-strand DNA-binding protein
MANLNKVMLIGRLTRDPEVRTFANGGKVARFGFAVNNRKFNQQSGQWEEEPVFIDIDAFNRETGRKLADLVEQYLRKGNQVFLEGHLKLDQWTDKEGQTRKQLRVVLDNLQFLEPRSEGAAAEGGRTGSRFGAQRPVEAPRSYAEPEAEPLEPGSPTAAPENEDLPF